MMGCSFKGLAAAALFAGACIAAPPSRVEAQSIGVPPLTLSVEAQSELAEIDSRATTATILLAVGIPAHIVGLGVAALGILSGAAAAIGGGGDGSLIVLGLVGGGVAVAGLVLLLIGAGMDIGSGVRRDRWRQRHGVSARLLPTLAVGPEGGTLGLVAAF